MAVGITAGRFAINRANDVAHQNAVDQIYTGLQAYYTDNREFPAPAETPQGMLSATGALGKYLDNGAFNGGTEATFYYSASTTDQQVVFICVSLGGLADTKNLGFYCNGNGFGSTATDFLPGVAITSKEVKYSATTPSTGYTMLKNGTNFTTSIWNGKTWGAE